VPTGRGGLGDDPAGRRGVTCGVPAVTPKWEIKKALGLDRREVPRILKTAVQTKKLKAKGQKRATVYTAR